MLAAWCGWGLFATVGAVSVHGISVGVDVLCASLFVGVSFHLAVSSLAQKAADG